MSELAVWNKKHSPCLIFSIVFNSDVLNHDKHFLRKERRVEVLPQSDIFFSDRLQNITVWVGVTSRELYFNLCFVRSTLASIRLAVTIVTPSDSR